MMPCGLQRAIVQGLKGVDPKVLHNASVEVVGSTPEEFAAFIKAEMERMGPAIKAAAFHN